MSRYTIETFAHGDIVARAETAQAAGDIITSGLSNPHGMGLPALYSHDHSPGRAFPFTAFAPEGRHFVGHMFATLAECRAFILRTHEGE